MPGSSTATDSTTNTQVTNLARLSSITDRSTPSYANPTSSSPVGSVLVSSTDTQVMLTSRRALSSTVANTNYGTSNFPSSLDAFTTVSNGQASSNKEYLELTNAAQGIESAFSYIVKAAPNDITNRLVNRTITAMASSDGLRLLGGAQTSEVRSPVVVSLGSELVVPSGVRFSSVDFSLSNSQKNALGLVTTVQDVKGLAFMTGSKFQEPSSSVITLPNSSTAGQVYARVDDNGTIRLLLRTTTFNPAVTLAPGRWYVYILFVLSAYSWTHS